MSSKNKKTEKISVEALIALFQQSPEEAYEQLIRSGIHTSPDAGKFWKAYKALNFLTILEHSPHAYDILLKTGNLQVFYQLGKLYARHMDACRKKIIALNPDPEALTKALFLVLELGETYMAESMFPNYSYHSLLAVKDILKSLLPKLKPTGRAAYSLELFNEAKRLLLYSIDSDLLRRFRDLYEWAGFDLKKNEGDAGYDLCIPERGSRDGDLYILNDLKTRYKRNYKQAESNKKVSEEAHFKQIDPLFKTDEGLMTLLYSGCTLVSQTPGTAGIAVDHAFLEKLISPDEEQRNEGMKELMHFMLTQNFYYNLRHALEGIYQPNDNIDQHRLRFEVCPGVRLPLYELFCATSCLSGMADGFRYLGQLPQMGEIHFVKQNCIGFLQVDFPDKGMDELVAEVDRYIVNYLPQIEKEYRPFCILAKDAILRYFRMVEELKNKSDDELGRLLDFLSDPKNSLPFNPLYKVGDKYLFAYKAFYKADVNRMVYDHLVTGKLFNSRGLLGESAEAKQVGENQRTREQRFNESVKKSMTGTASHVACGVEFPENIFGELSGDVDVLAYFKEENIIMSIQVKLSNTSQHSEKGKQIWIKGHIRGKALDQVYKDSKRVLSPKGLELIREKLKIEGAPDLAKAKVYPLIVTDNFYVDHERFKYNDEGDLVTCISFFELDHLLRGLAIDPQQKSWEPVKGNKAAANLKFLIEHNIFWSFLKPSEQKKKTRSLRAINKENKISLVI